MVFTAHKHSVHLQSHDADVYAQNVKVWNQIMIFNFASRRIFTWAIMSGSQEDANIHDFTTELLCAFCHYLNYLVAVIITSCSFGSSWPNGHDMDDKQCLTEPLSVWAKKFCLILHAVNKVINRELFPLLVDFLSFTKSTQSACEQRIFMIREKSLQKLSIW